MIMVADEAENKTAAEIPTPAPEEELLLCRKFIQTREDENHCLTGIDFTNTDQFNFL